MSHINPELADLLSPRELETRSAAYYCEGIIEKQDPRILGEAITLMESSRPEHRIIALEVLKTCYSVKSRARKIAITGPPGVGKSTFIDSLTDHFVQLGKKVAILPVDPSSQSGKGSILGDKTRMERLSRLNNVFIRPSPASGHYGGVTSTTYEAMIFCLAAGVEYVFVETVGVGQSEFEVYDLCDMSVLLVLPGSGDELQGIKKGIVEVVDMIVVNKSDEGREDLAAATQKDYQQALHILDPEDIDFSNRVIRYSSISSSSVSSYVNFEDHFFQRAIDSGSLVKKRARQEGIWVDQRMKDILGQKLLEAFDENEQLKQFRKSTIQQSPVDFLLALERDLKVDIRI